MRLPWRGRSKRPAAGTQLPSPPPRSRAWDEMPPLRASVAVNPPLTARAAEHAAGMGVRLRSTSVLVHPARAAAAPRVPEVAGTMVGIAAVASAPIVDTPPPAARRHDSATLTQPQLPDQTPRSVPVRPALDPPHALLHLDPDTASAIGPPRRVSGARAPQPVSFEPVALAQPDPEPAEAPAEAQPRRQPLGNVMSQLPAPVPGHTVVRRRPQPGGPRPVGLQAPLEHPRTPEAAVRAPAPEAAAPPAVEQVPERVAAAMMHLHRADLRDVRVVRGEDATRLAEATHAKALTVSGEVLMPRARGSLESAENRGLLAHELTHVLQQRRLGTDVPMEHTPMGRALEAQAAATEQMVRGDPGSAAAPVAEPRPATRQTQARTDLDAVRAVQDELTASGFATRAPDGSLVFAAAATSSLQAGPPFQRAPDTPAPAPAPDNGLSDGAASAQPGAAPTPTSSPSPSVPSALVVGEPAPAVNAATPGASPSSVQPDVQTVVVHDEQPAPPAASAPAPDMDEMARRLYERVAARLRTELTLDRERAGLLTDLR